MKHGYVYILTNRPNGVLYIGCTSDLATRIGQHRSRAIPGFSRTYNCDKLVWFEYFENLHDARQCEVRMKKWNREWKVKRIEADMALRPHVRLQAWGESLDPHRMDRLMLLDERLVRQYEKLLGMLTKVRALQTGSAQPSAPAR